MVKIIHPALPAEPVLDHVTWTDCGTGLQLDYAEYRKLESNIMRMRAYQADLLGLIRYYESLD